MKYIARNYKGLKRNWQPVPEGKPTLEQQERKFGIIKIKKTYNFI